MMFCRGFMGLMRRIIRVVRKSMSSECSNEWSVRGW